MNNPLQTIRELIKQPPGETRWIDVLDVLIEAWDEYNSWVAVVPKSDAAAPQRPHHDSFSIQLGTLLAECFAAKHGHQNQCVLLAAWNEDQQETEKRLPILVAELNATRTLLDWPALLEPLALRLQLMKNLGALLGPVNAASDETARHLNIWLSGARKQFGCCIDPQHQPWQQLSSVGSHLKPAAVAALGTQADLAKSFETAVRNLFECKQDELTPWRDPAIAYLADLLMQVSRTSDDAWATSTGHSDSPNDWLPGHTWILISVDDDRKTNVNPTGMVLLLRVDEIPDGCGAFYPDPALAGYLSLDHTFQEALRNAWQVVVGQMPLKSRTANEPINDASGSREPEVRQVDYRWSLTVIDDSDNHDLRQLPLFCRLSGHSVELAVATALKSVVEKTPTDRTRAATARFAERDVNKLGLNPILAAVLAVDNKDKGLSIPVSWHRATRAMHRMAIKKIVCAEPQSVEGILSAELLRKHQFEHAWRELTQSSARTQEFNTEQRNRMQNLFRVHCFLSEEYELGSLLPDDIIKSPVPLLGSYILNNFQRKPDDRDPPHLHVAVTTADGTKTEARPLLISDAERANELVDLINGISRLDPAELEVKPNSTTLRPIRLIADSGMGKTTLLHLIVWKVASGKDGRIPILLDNLSQYLHETSEFEFLRDVAAKLQCKDDIEWLQQKANRGEVVWLLDAVDQTRGDTGNLPKLLKWFPNCSWLITLRGDAVVSKPEAWTGITFDDLTVLPFDESMARSYLGEYAKAVFKKLSEPADSEAGSILTIPFILYLLKQFALRQGTNFLSIAPSEFSMWNRYAIYRSVLCRPGGLIDYGLQKIQKDAEQEVKDLFRDLDPTVKLCRQLAWWNLQQDLSENEIPQTLEGDWLNYVGPLLKTDKSPQWIQRAIQRLNMLTVGSMFEMENSPDPFADIAPDAPKPAAFSWRHRSFFEFLGGCHLAEMLLNGDQVAQEEARIFLRKVHRFDQAANRRATWWWTLRFALCHAKTLAARPGEELSADERFAVELIGWGNPWVVYESIDWDGLVIGRQATVEGRPVELLARWLVHRNWSPRRDYTEAMNASSSSLPDIVIDWWRENGSAVGDALYSREYLDSGYVDSLLDLKSAVERSGRWAAGTDWKPSVDEGRLVLPDVYLRRPANKILDDFVKDFVPLPVDSWVPPRQHHDLERLEEAGLEMTGVGADRWVAPLAMGGVSMGRFFVTNALYELYDPSHRWWRDEYSDQPDQPVVYVSWYMARSFCEWLTRTLNDRRVYRLPSEWEWECAVRWGDQHDDVYWWGNHYRSDRGWFYNTEGQTGATRKRELSEQAHNRLKENGFDHAGNLVDPVGNVWIWCANSVFTSTIAVSELSRV
ncbi:MAG: SUMF1/EgtB/PvdO family nonheme iron enzyme, partial [Planctomycetaceae bacterium]|nr:SUMF1/EgtB/PvdO family nonheme iron enzyme [Planctomycetaceae bacterium]